MATNCVLRLYNPRQGGWTALLQLNLLGGRQWGWNLPSSNLPLPFGGSQGYIFQTSLGVQLYRWQNSQYVGFVQNLIVQNAVPGMAGYVNDFALNTYYTGRVIAAGLSDFAGAAEVKMLAALADPQPR